MKPSHVCYHTVILTQGFGVSSESPLRLLLSLNTDISYVCEDLAM